MDLIESDALTGDPSRHWYYQSKFAGVLALCNMASVRTVADIGAGVGLFARYLLERTEVQRVICVDTGYENDSSETFLGKEKEISFTRHDTPLAADLVLMLDVLEHVQDDVALLQHWMRGLEPGTQIVISVPAFNWLWSPHDEVLGHYRRYTRRGLIKVLQSAGLKVEACSYFFGAVLPLVALVRLLSRKQKDRSSSDLRQHSSLVNSILARIGKIEARCLPHNKIAGVSVLARAIVS